LRSANPDNKVIVGLDPGTTTGIGIIDLNMKPLFFKSIRGANKSIIIKHIAKVGEPILIACDVADAPESVKKIASFFNINCSTPKRDLTASEKRRLIREYFPLTLKKLDAHTFDALTAALKAYLKHKNKFDSVEARLKKLTQPLALDTIKAEIIKGVKLTNILAKELIKFDEEPKERVIKIHVHKENTKNQSENKELKERSMRILRWERDKLSNEVKRLKNERDKLEQSLQQKNREEHIAISKENRYRLQEKKIQYLHTKLAETERTIKELQKRTNREKTWKLVDYIPLQEISSFTSNDVEKVRDQINDETCILLVNAAGGGPTTAKKLVEAQPRAVIRCTEMSYHAEKVLYENNIPVISSEQLEFRYLKGIPAVKKKDIEEIIGNYKRHKIELSLTGIHDSTKAAK
jgi:predicted RNase H-like nuclease (RuvC/YqgF family)